ncbi:hypothetical protein BDP27DRAFT_1427074 [Rhodocollybia butyracea]|uniref:Uncharacterized protein n=1 Tax=Rhodocollybia butyracea TaxID=206335 RepID=A0A9P5PHG1_9AGAR|nr:hypothetical protein BDP27DRAFT_1427074 [Rhodocollybia butyracea]
MRTHQSYAYNLHRQQDETVQLSRRHRVTDPPCPDNSGTCRLPLVHDECATHRPLRHHLPHDNCRGRPHLWYYFAQQFSFVGIREIGYTGLQPRPDSNGNAVLHAAFSSFAAGTTTTDKNCSPGANGGPGVSCSVEWNGVYNRTYNLEVRTTGNHNWVGTAIDTVTGTEVQIGSWTLPVISGGILSCQAGFVEWYAAEPPCAKLPYQQTIFGDRARHMRDPLVPEPVLRVR